MFLFPLVLKIKLWLWVELLVVSLRNQEVSMCHIYLHCCRPKCGIKIYQSSNRIGGLVDYTVKDKSIG